LLGRPLRPQPLQVRAAREGREYLMPAAVPRPVANPAPRRPEVGARLEPGH